MARQILLRLWASPCSLLGLLAAGILLGGGGRARWVRGALEVNWRACLADCGPGARSLPFRAIVFGHVILAVSAEELQRLGPHERVHVAQYERWGPLFLLAYPASSLWSWLSGGDPYRDNVFEVEARELSGI